MSSEGSSISAMTAPQTGLFPSVWLHSLFSLFLPHLGSFCCFPASFPPLATGDQKWSTQDFLSQQERRNNSVISPNQPHHFFWQRVNLYKLRLQPPFQRNRYSRFGYKLQPPCHNPLLHWNTMEPTQPGTGKSSLTHNNFSILSKTSPFPRDKTPNVLCFTSPHSQ